MSTKRDRTTVRSLKNGGFEIHGVGAAETLFGLASQPNPLPRKNTETGQGDVPANVRFATMPTGVDGLSKRDEDRILTLLTYRSRATLRLMYIAYRRKLGEMSDQELAKECEDKIWASAFSNNNPRSDWHWECDLCYDESVRRGGAAAPIYAKAYRVVLSQHLH